MAGGDVPDPDGHKMKDRARQPPEAGFRICCINTACLSVAQIRGLSIKLASTSPQGSGTPHPDLMDVPLLDEGKEHAWGLKATAAIPGLQPVKRHQRNQGARVAITRPREVSNAFVSPADSK